MQHTRIPPLFNYRYFAKFSLASALTLGLDAAEVHSAGQTRAVPVKLVVRRSKPFSLVSLDQISGKIEEFQFHFSVVIQVVAHHRLTGSRIGIRKKSPGGKKVDTGHRRGRELAGWEIVRVPGV